MSKVTTMHSLKPNNVICDRCFVTYKKIHWNVLSFVVVVVHFNIFSFFFFPSQLTEKSKHEICVQLGNLVQKHCKLSVCFVFRS